MVEYAVINYAQIVYIRKQVHDLKGLESNRAMEKMRMFTAGLMGARRENMQLFSQMNDLALAEAEAEDRSWYSCFLRKKAPKTSSMFYRMAVKAAKAKKKLKMRDPAKVDDSKLKKCNQNKTSFKRERRLNKCFLNSRSSLKYPDVIFMGRKARKFQVVNRIDNVSKVIFPSLYVAFNVVYWIAFLYWIPDEIDQILALPEKATHT
uniref:Neur_chan_memb domain-containing protein n=1 Tax=Angiostrongylus cantonensis TaxID=6313 RepID=A0A0K0D3D5_ANGCA